MKPSATIKSTITAEAFFEPTVVGKRMGGAQVDARISQYASDTAAGRVARRRERLLAKAPPSIIDVSEIEASARERDVRDAVRCFIKAATWLDDVSDDGREEILQLVAQHQRGAISSGEYHKAINEARRAAIGSTPSINYERLAAAHRRLREYGPTGGW